MDVTEWKDGLVASKADPALSWFSSRSTCPVSHTGALLWALPSTVPWAEHTQDTVGPSIMKRSTVCLCRVCSGTLQFCI